mgnify:FL=1
MTTKIHPLWSVCKKHKGNTGLDIDFMREQGGQEKAFDNCIEFLKRVKRTKNPSVRTYGSCSGYFKHLIESPFNSLSGSFRWKLERDHRCGRMPNIEEMKIYTGYVYKGTFNMAARSMGFICDKDKYYPHSLNIRWNIAKRGLDRAILEYIKCIIKTQ